MGVSTWTLKLLGISSPGNSTPESSTNTTSQFNFLGFLNKDISPDYHWLPSSTDHTQIVSVDSMGSSVAYTRHTTIGKWQHFTISLKIPFKSFSLVDMSYVGAFFGSFLYQLRTQAVNYWAPGENLNTLVDLLDLWLQFTPSPVGEPDYYETSSLVLTFLDAEEDSLRGSSVSRVQGQALRKRMSSLVDTDPDLRPFLQVLALSDMEKDKFDESVIKCAFSLLFLEKQTTTDDVMQIEGTELTVSDQMWTGDELHPTSNAAFLKVSLNFAKFTKRPSAPTGCSSRYSDNGILRAFSKSAKSKGQIKFKPEGLTANFLGTNCFIECICYHLLQLGLQDFESKFLLNPALSNYLHTFVDVLNPAIIQTICSSLPFNIYACIEGDDAIFTCKSIFRTTADPATHTLHLVIYRDEAVSSARFWHAIVVADALFLNGRRRCPNCKEFLLKESAHFEKCKRCLDCHKHYQDDGKHYVSCKKRAFIPGKQVEPLKVLPFKKEKSSEWQNTKNVWFCDFESFCNKDGIHVPYLICLKEIGKPESMRSFFGKPCLKEFADYIMKGKTVSGYLFCHNGSGYDFNLILLALLKHGYIPDSGMTILTRGTKILTADVKKKPCSLNLRDSYLYLPSSLSRLCKDFKIDQGKSKTSFDHNKIKSFQDFSKHMTESIAYCKQDVIALEEIYTKFAAGLWKIAPVSLPSSMSLAAHAMEMWKNMEGSVVVNSIPIPKYSDYLILREMYHGGRVLCTTKAYNSHMYEQVIEVDEEGSSVFFNADTTLSEDTFEAIKHVMDNLRHDQKEELKLVDVVSLYPFCMKQFLFPAGKFCGTRDIVEEDREKTATDIMNTIKAGKWTVINDYFEVRAENQGYSLLKGEMFRSCYKVDMDCPQNIYVAFIMRKENFSPIQNLKNLREFWVTGVELFEAIRIGYTLKSVLAIMSWEKSMPIFRNYIETLFKIKEEYKKDKSNVMYIVAKLLMNALSGKFGQKIVSKVVTLLSQLPDDPDAMFSNLENVASQVIEFSADKKSEAETIGYMITGEKKEQELETKLPTQISVFILAYARRVMSKMLRKVNGYRDKNHTILYTDTDSMVVRKSTFILLQKHGFIGHNLGQLEDEFPNERIIAGRFLAPKTYCLAMLKEVEVDEAPPRCAVAYKIRCKGIPHRGDIFFANDYDVGEDSLKVAIAKVDESISGPVEDLSQRFYVLKRKVDNVVELVHPFINTRICDLILNETHYLQVHFGSICKSRDKTQKFHLKTIWVSRSVGFTPWWGGEHCPRIVTQDPFDITKCKGEDNPPPSPDITFTTPCQNQEEQLEIQDLDEVIDMFVDF